MKIKLKIADKLKWGDQYKLVKSDPYNFIPVGTIVTLGPINPYYKPYGNMWFGIFKSQNYCISYWNVLDHIKCYKKIK